MERHVNRRCGCGIHVVGHREGHRDRRNRYFRVPAEGTGRNRADARSDQRLTPLARRTHAAENLHPGDVRRLDRHRPVSAADSVDVVEIDCDRLHRDLDFARSGLRCIDLVEPKHVGRCTEFVNQPSSHVAPSSRLLMQAPFGRPIPWRKDTRGVATGHRSPAFGAPGRSPWSTFRTSAPTLRSARLGHGRHVRQPLRRRALTIWSPRVGSRPFGSDSGCLGAGDTPDGLDSFADIAWEVASGTVGLVKLQVAFYERHGWQGFRMLQRLISEAQGTGLLVIVDAKRGDVGTTNDAYAEAYLGADAPLGADALTVHPHPWAWMPWVLRLPAPTKQEAACSLLPALPIPRAVRSSPPPPIAGTPLRRTCWLPSGS